MKPRIVPATGWAVFLPWYDPLVAVFTSETTFKSHLFERAQLRRGMRVLDVGCGTGTLAVALQAAAPDVQMLAVDADQRILKQAADKEACHGQSPASAIQWLIGNAVHLPVDDASVDLVTCSLLLHHLTASEKEQALTEIRRVLRPRGRVLLADYCRPNSLVARLQFLPVRLLDGWHRTRCNVSGRIPQLLSQVGLESVRETKRIASLLGTIRCYEACKPAASR